MRQQPVAPPDRLGLLQVGVTGHDEVELVLGARDGHLDEVTQDGVQLAQLIPQPQAHVGCDLLVAGSAGVQLASNLLANDLRESALVGCVDVLVVLLDDKGVCAPFFGDLLEPALDLGELVLGQDAALGVGSGEGNGAGNILLPEYTIVGEGLVVLNHQGVEALYESRHK